MKNNLNLLSALLVDGIKNSVINELKNNKENLQERPQAFDDRTVEVRLINETDKTLTLSNSRVESGVWSIHAPKLIAPFTTVIMETSSDAWLTGTAGWVEYSTDDDLLQFRWNNPYMGSNSYSESSAYNKHILPRVGGIGNTALVKWTIYKASA